MHRWYFIKPVSSLKSACVQQCRCRHVHHADRLTLRLRAAVRRWRLIQWCMETEELSRSFVLSLGTNNTQQGGQRRVQPPPHTVQHNNISIIRTVKDRPQNTLHPKTDYQTLWPLGTDMWIPPHPSYCKSKTPRTVWNSSAHKVWADISAGWL